MGRARNGATAVTSAHFDVVFGQRRGRVDGVAAAVEKPVAVLNGRLRPIGRVPDNLWDTTKQIQWVNPNKMVFSSGHKAFDRALGAVSKGQCLSGTQTSMVVRAYNDCQVGSNSFEPGHLRDFDLQKFVEGGIPDDLLQRINEFTADDQSVLLYRFFHSTSAAGNSETEHGFIVTEGSTHRFLTMHVTGPKHRKSQGVLDALAPYIAVAP